jgi:crotonobetainyl-CoA:carnitine CoA-transferase CaiB-like acyl-CoA transferase
MGYPAWADSPRFRSQDDRHRHQDELDRRIAEWTAPRDRHDVMHLLQSAGVRAAAVQDASDTSEHDPQIEHRGLFFELDHPVIGPARFEGIPFDMAHTAPDNWRSAPLLGEDNDYVMRGVLQLDDDEIKALEEAGTIA